MPPSTIAQPPQHNSVFEDIFTFSLDSQPRLDRKSIQVGPNVHIRFKSVEDRVACKVALVADEDLGHTDLQIDASACDHESRLMFTLPGVADHLCAGRAGGVFELAFELTARMFEEDSQPIRQVSLFENDPSHALRTVHKLKKSAPLSTSFLTHSITRSFAKPVEEAGSYEFGVIIAPKASAFIVRRAVVRAVGLVMADYEITQCGNRLQGTIPVTATRTSIRLVRGGRVANVSLEDGRFSCLQSGSVVEFDAGLAGLVPPQDPEAAEEDSLCHAMLYEGDGLVAFTKVEPPPVDNAEKAVSAAAGHLDQHYQTLKQAEFEIRRFRNATGLALLDQVAKSSTDHDRSVARLRMRAFVSQRRFEHAIALFESLDERLRNEPTMRSRYIEACANIGDFDRARLEMEKVAFLDRRTATANIAHLYRFTPLLSPDYRALFTDMMASVSPEARAQSKVVMRCAHDYIRARHWKGYIQLVNVLDRFDLSASEKGRLALLRFQMAFELGNTSAMIDQLNTGLGLLKASPVALLNDNLPLTLDNIVGQKQPADESGPLVSIMMTSFNSEATIGYAIQSILDQNYRNIELLVIDDASSDGSATLISEYAARDPRVIPILATSNSGTYVSKNMALMRAKGEFVTCQDSDDWAHPQKIETGVARLLANPRLVATGVQHVRMSPDAGLQFRSDYVRPDASSLLYRARPVKRSIGFYDSVRAGADSEFQRRIELAFGTTAVKYGQELLSLVLWSAGSLSGGGDFAIDDDSGVLPPSRNAYRRSFVDWHERAINHYMPFPLTERLFEAPATMLPSRP